MRLQGRRRFKCGSDQPCINLVRSRPMMGYDLENSSRYGLWHQSRGFSLALGSPVVLLALKDVDTLE